MTPSALLEDRWTPARTAAYLGITTATLRKWRCEGKGPAYHKYGDTQQARISYDPASVRRFAREARVEPVNERTAPGGGSPQGAMGGRIT